METISLDIGLTQTPFHAALQRRLRNRAARADSAVELTPETLHRWLEEEARSLRREAAFYKVFAHFRQWN